MVAGNRNHDQRSAVVCGRNRQGDHGGITFEFFPGGCITNKMDEEDLTQLIIDNIYETLDPATYGVE